MRWTDQNSGTPSCYDNVYGANDCIVMYCILVKLVGEGRGNLTMFQTLPFCLFSLSFTYQSLKLIFFLVILLKLMGSSAPLIWYNVEGCI